MSRMRCPPLSVKEKSELWARWKAGEPASAIARALDRSAGTVHYIVTGRGGLPPRAPTRAARVLQTHEREEISRGLAGGQPLRAIARQLRRAPSTISREVARHGGRPGYRATVADRRAWRRARRPKASRLAGSARLRCVVAAKLARQWSPVQIAGWLRWTYAAQPAMQISHEAIYQSVFVQSRGALKQQLVAQLRRGATYRHARAARRTNQGRGRIVDAVSIRERPATVADRAVPGHWEGDLLTGARATHVATLVERASRYVLLIRVPSKDSGQVVRAIARRIQTLPRHLRRSLTWDRGSEMANHRAFTVATDVQVYFCDPRSPWQRGSNENTNGLLRQYLPRTLDLSTVTQRRLDAIARRLNERPRLTLGFHTPADKLATIVASTG
jgi:IS30 family transposase